MIDMQHFGKTLQACRKEYGLTQNALADMLGLSAQSVSYWECGNGMPDVAHLCRIADIFSISLDVLLRNEEGRLKGLIGIDGGGTKTEFVLIDERGYKLNSVVLGGSNPNTCGINVAIDIICQGISYLRPKTMNVIGIFLGGAGMETGDNKNQVLRALREAYPEIKIDCDNDIYNVIACSSQPDRCVAAISGTGCVVNSSYQGTLRRVGGFGYLFERSGSGYDIGRDALTAALRAGDGVGATTIVTDLIEERIGGSIRDHLHDLYQKDVSYIASFAPLVFQAAAKKDLVALEILESNSEYMASMIQTALSHAADIDHVIFSGGLFSKDELFFQSVKEKLHPCLVIERMTYSPVWGACLQCAKLCQLDEMPSLKNFLKE